MPTRSRPFSKLRSPQARDTAAWSPTARSGAYSGPSIKWVVRVLLIVDSLDEAADQVGQAGRLRELTSLIGWRVIVTSRPAAWQASYRGKPGRADGPRVVELQNLAYPDDVEAIIRRWFSADLERGDQLIEQIRARPDLARVAHIPLIVTFYCLLAEEPDAVARLLPARRRDLYASLVRRLLRGLWTSNPPGPDAAPDMEYCEAVLSDWAWQAVQDRVTPTGLGDWGESFAQPDATRGHVARALDNIAPKVGEGYEGGITRQFVHRTRPH